MLIRYKKAFEKIAMGLLSFMPTEKDIKQLQQTMKNYEDDQSWRLYLWKQEEDIIGLAGVVVKEDKIEIQHICVNPSYRHEGIGTKIVRALNELYVDSTILPNEYTAGFLEQCDLEDSEEA
ncbi:GNAT family N-acetyltransferase [Bacillus coahuilensis]|uniref:GNAT family N-acetyltransferase n=1 Tax=Bacillus coahuilensis TaxID=408580 RepID=UPI000185101F|nr:GNAT family N-acetyltransferase [Bacillus coahuilensis]